MTRLALPAVRIVEEGMREGMQIESASISTADKIKLLDALSATGLQEIVVGSFVRSDWVPQMAEVEKVIEGMTPVPGVTYRALVLNRKGVERMESFVPPLSVDRRPRLSVHACDVFAQRNTNRTQADEIAGWAAAVAAAVGAGRPAMVRVNAAFGSNFVGDIAPDYVIELLGRMIKHLDEGGIPVEEIWLGDPMGWNSPLGVETLLGRIRARWPDVRRFYLHLHNQRGAAMVSAYAAIRALPDDCTLTVDTAVGGIGGCPYCGNGRATGMIATEDFVDLLEEMGMETGVDRDRLIDAAILAEEIIGHPLYGKLALAGPRPRGDRRYPPDMPFVETLDEASHFRVGPAVYEGRRTPWLHPITSWQLGHGERSEKA
jgi:hydroxymethylglutaryl-CoA lyase